MRYRADLSLVRHPRVLLGGSPLRLFRLTDAGGRLIDRALAGDDIRSNPLTERLIDAGALHPVPDGAAALRPSDVTIVIPAYGSAVVVPDHGGPVFVVDDASPSPVVTSTTDATLIRRATNGGPGAARMSGLAEVTTPFVAFVDADVELAGGWLEPLLAHFVDPKVALVAPRVMSIPGRSRLARYETLRSPLDLGDFPARIAARTRVSYVPAAVMVARTDVLRTVGGFDPLLRTGEDVDLVWRLVTAGHRVRYEPGSTVAHQPRSTLAGWLRQRVGYGRSAAPLACRHPGALAPVGVSGWSAAAWVAGAIGHPVLGVALAAGSAVALPRKLPDLARRDALQLAAHGHVGAGRQLAAALTRVWWPIALLSRRSRRWLALALVVPGAIDWWRQRRRVDLDPVSYLVLRGLDDASYGLGVWLGVVNEREPAPLLPDLSNWPPRHRSSRKRRRVNGQGAPSA